VPAHRVVVAERLEPFRDRAVLGVPHRSQVAVHAGLGPRCCVALRGGLVVVALHEGAVRLVEHANGVARKPGGRKESMSARLVRRREASLEPRLFVEPTPLERPLDAGAIPTLSRLLFSLDGVAGLQGVQQLAHELVDDLGQPLGAVRLVHDGNRIKSWGMHTTASPARGAPIRLEGLSPQSSCANARLRVGVC